MLDQETTDLIETTVAAQVDTGNEFTAFDITREVRASGVNCRHDAVKGVVHALYLDGKMPGYARELRNYGGPVPAWCYYPNSTGDGDGDGDGSLSLPLPAHLAPSVTARSYTQPSVGASAPAAADPLFKVKAADKRNTICIPSRLVRAAGLKPGDAANVYADPYESRLVATDLTGYKSKSGQHLDVRLYRVDKHGNLRITRSWQEAAGLKTWMFNITVEATVVVVKAH